VAEIFPTRFLQSGRPVIRFYEFAEYCLEPAERRLLRHGHPVPLTPKAFDTLLLLVQNNGHLVEKEEFIRKVWEGHFVGDDSLTRNIAVLRKVLGEDGRENKYIETVSKRGYRFIARVAEKRQEEAEQGVAASPAPLIGKAERRWIFMTSLPAVAIASIFLAFILIRFVQREREAQQNVPKLNLQAIQKFTSGAYSRATRPMISPDGKTLLYVVDEGLYVAPTTGGDSLKIADKLRWPGDMPVFTADGASVVFSRCRGGEDGSRSRDLWIVSSRGGIPKCFIVEASGAGFSPDGMWVAYTKHLGDRNPLWLSPLDRLEEHREVSELGFTPRWSPDGKWIAYTSSSPLGGDGVLWITSAALSERRQLTQEPQQIYGLTWSADSRSLIFASRAATAGFLQLSQVSIANHSVRPLTRGIGDYVSPSASPDGKTLFFCHIEEGADLFVAEGVGNPRVEQITRGEQHGWPRLSPSGERIASVQLRADFNEHLYVIDLKTGKSTRLSDRIAYHPCWLDDEQLAYLSFDAAAQETQVRLVNLATGLNSTWTRFPGKVEWLAVHPGRKKLAIVAKSPEGRQKIVLRDLEKQSDVTLAEEGEYEQLRWLPGGQALSWSGPVTAGRASNGVWVIEPNRKLPRRIVSDGYAPAWSADEASVYFIRLPQSLWGLDVRRNVLTEMRASGLVNAFDLVGQRLVFVRITAHSEIYSVPIDQ
jgi:DNA-binding winged helix-turn-helix (wHTH) protein/Tol biopolymer transport system component